MNLKGRSLLTLKDYSKDEILFLLDLADTLKKEKLNGVYKKRMQNKNVALIFEKPSTRTRCAFTVACADEGAHPEFLGVSDIQLGHKESVADTARVLGRMFDIIEFRGFSQKTCEDLAKYSKVPVINGLTDDDHPTQALADLMTIREQKGALSGIKVVFAGDGRNNVANALMIACCKVGINFVIASPQALFPDKTLYELCKAYAKESGGSVNLESDIEKAVLGADVIYTDVWVSMGEEAKSAERMEMLKPYQVNENIMSIAGEDAIFLHCLPAVKGNEVTEGVFESSRSFVFDEAENRMHTIKAVMVAVI
ncbi:MAG: ornithine carbamoyltransferase [Clostridiales bacterium]|nr:ornithine carbamoyltransferase [Clostridiales bacterium]